LGRTGEVANKIGTYTKAVLAKRHGIPFYVAIPLSSIDWKLESGFDIPIEERHESEVLGAWGVAGRARSEHHTPRSTLRLPRSVKRVYVRVANPTSGALNPGFDVTPPDLVTGFITPVGVLKPGDLWARRRQLGCTQGEKRLSALTQGE
jgi:methylthioribose-1-phosphate isomerase